MLRSLSSRPLVRTGNLCVSSRALYSTKPAESSTTSTPNIPEPAPPVTLFPSLDSIAAEDLVLKKSTPSKAGWYNITRTRGNQLPVYSEVRANGHRTTLIRRIEGSVPLLKQDLKISLGLKNDEIKIKPTSNQIVIKGDRVKEVRALLRSAAL